MSTELTPLVIIVAPVKFVRPARAVTVGYLDRGDAQVVLRLSRGVRTKEEAMGCVWFVGGSRKQQKFWNRKKGLLSFVLFAIWEPLARQTRPIQCMGNNNVVKIRCIFLPLRG